MQEQQELQPIIQEAINELKGQDPSTTAKSLQTLCSFLPVASCGGTDSEDCNNNYFMENYYSKVIETITDCFSVEWFKNLATVTNGEELLDQLFFKGYLHETLIILSGQLNTSSSTFKRNKCIQLVDALVHNHLGDLLWLQCQMSQEMHIRETWPHLLTHLVTLPDRIINSRTTEKRHLFYPQQFIPCVTKEIERILDKIYDSLKAERVTSTEFVGQLMGKIALHGHGELMWDSLLPSLEHNVRIDVVWCRIYQRLLTHVPPRSLESTLVPLLKRASWCGVVTQCLGSALLENPKLKFLVTHKWLLVRHFTQDKFLQNLVGYLASSHSFKTIFWETLLSVLDVWADASAVRHSSYEQHLYITKAVIASLAYVQDRKQDRTSDLLERLMSGMQCHLDSPIHRVRMLGMVLAECLTGRVHTDSKPLTFEYEETEETRQLKALLFPPEDPGLPLMTGALSKLSVTDNSSHDCGEQRKKDANGTATEANRAATETSEAATETSKRSTETTTTTTGVADLDSDDDLEPYDIPHNTNTKVKAPTYLTECMAGLISGKDAERTEVCLTSATSLIRHHATSAKELIKRQTFVVHGASSYGIFLWITQKEIISKERKVAEEFTKILVHLEDTFSLDGFTLWKRKALVSLAVVAPPEVSAYLTREFYSPNYSLRQRLDMLEVLTHAATELSSPVGGGEAASRGRGTGAGQELVEELEGDEAAESWRRVVQRRIDSKTRRFAHGTQPPPAGRANRFAPVAGHFFFPLLHQLDRREQSLDLLGQDYLVLARLLYSLGLILHAALHAPIVRQMSQALLGLTWTLRFHPQPAVRQAVLFAVAMVIITTPSAVLMEHLQEEVLENRGWLQDVLEKDTDNECRNLALQNLALLQNSVKEYDEGARDVS